MFADIYRAGAERGIPARELDATLLWQVGAMLRPPRSADDETREVFAARMRGDDVEFRASSMAQVIPLSQATSLRRPEGEPPDAP